MREPRRALAETLSEIDSLRSAAGQSGEDGFDLDQLALEAGETRQVVEMLLAGNEPPAEDVSARIVRRFAHLRESRRRDDGTRYSYEEIAASFGATRARLSNLVSSWEKNRAQGDGQGTSRAGGPLAATQAGIERFFFGEPNGWLAADPETTLARALKPHVDKLLAKRGVAPRTRAVALRTAAALPDDQWRLVEGVIDSLVAKVRKEHPPPQ